MPGSTLIIYETNRSPDVLQNSLEEKSPIELISTIGMLTLPAGASISDDYILQAGLTAEVRVEDNKYVVVEYRIDEYGIGDSLQDAQQDLFNSLIDYLVSLEKRENRLGDRERHNLEMLRTTLVRR